MTFVHLDCGISIPKLPISHSSWTPSRPIKPVRGLLPPSLCASLAMGEPPFVYPEDRFAARLSTLTHPRISNRGAKESPQRFHPDRYYYRALSCGGSGCIRAKRWCRRWYHYPAHPRAPKTERDLALYNVLP